jgi:hypothetical protein
MPQFQWLANSLETNYREFVSPENTRVVEPNQVWPSRSPAIQKSFVWGVNFAG